MSVRRVTRDTALAAVRMAATALEVDPVDLSPADYRAFRGDPARTTALPSEFTISLLFGGWHRAVEHVRPRIDPSDTEAEVRTALYGDRGH